MFFFNIPFDIPKIEIPEIKIPFEISADPGFSQESTKFSANQTIYVRVTNPNTSPADTHILVLHNANYDTLQTFELAEAGNTYSTSFQAPNVGGNYSLEVKLVTNGSTSSFVRTIQVGEGGSNSSVKISQNNSSEDNEDSYSPTPSASAEPTASPTPASPTPKPQVLGLSRGNIFERFWFSIHNFWENFWH